MTTNEKQETGTSVCPKCRGFLMTGCDECGDGLVPVTHMEEYQRKRRTPEPPADHVGPEHSL